MPHRFHPNFAGRSFWPVLALAAVIWLLGVSPALALLCPPPEELQVVDGWWSAPGGWQQDRTYQKPLASARISGFAAASFHGNLRGPGKLMCLYVVKGQTRAEYTKIFHPSQGGPMDFDWDCPTATTDITCTCVGLKRRDCEVRD